VFPGTIMSSIPVIDLVRTHNRHFGPEQPSTYPGRRQHTNVQAMNARTPAHGLSHTAPRSAQCWYAYAIGESLGDTGHARRSHCRRPLGVCGREAQAERDRPVAFSADSFAVDTPLERFVGCLLLWIVFVPLYVSSTSRPAADPIAECAPLI
jgi:hypothetical protein